MIRADRVLPRIVALMCKRDDDGKSPLPDDYLLSEIQDELTMAGYKVPLRGYGDSPLARPSDDTRRLDARLPVVFGGYVLKPDVLVPRDEMHILDERSNIVGRITGIQYDAAINAGAGQ
jgi:hypothetical protein